MKKLILALTLATVLTFAFTSPVFAALPLHRVTGGGTVLFEGWGKETYGFTAIQVDESGNAKGNVHFTWHYPSDVTGAYPWVMQADVLYLAVNASTGDAWIGGVITKSNDPSYVGQEFFIRVQDGGEGRKASGPDMIGYTYLGYPASSALYKWTWPELFEFTNGNVQLK